MPGGALELIDARRARRRRPDLRPALRPEPGRRPGRAPRGPVTGAADQRRVTLNGHGGHTSRPHLTEDLTFALAKVVTELPAVLSRRLDPRAGVSVVWGSVHAGRRHNVIPATGRSPARSGCSTRIAWADAETIVQAAGRAVVAPYGVRAEIDYQRGVPPVVNERPPSTARHAVERGAGHGGRCRRRRAWAARTSAGTSTGSPGRWAGSAPARRGRDVRPAPGRPRWTSARVGIGAKCWPRAAARRRWRHAQTVLDVSDSVTVPPVREVLPAGRGLGRQYSVSLGAAHPWRVRTRSTIKEASCAHHAMKFAAAMSVAAVALAACGEQRRTAAATSGGDGDAGGYRAPRTSRSAWPTTSAAVATSRSTTRPPPASTRRSRSLGVESEESEADDGEAETAREERLRTFADAGYNPIIAVGFAYAESVGQGRRGQYPDSHLRDRRRRVSRLGRARTSPAWSSPRSRARSSSARPRR